MSPVLSRSRRWSPPRSSRPGARATRLSTWLRVELVFVALTCRLAHAGAYGKLANGSLGSAALPPRLGWWLMEPGDRLLCCTWALTSLEAELSPVVSGLLTALGSATTSTVAGSFRGRSGLCRAPPRVSTSPCRSSALFTALTLPQRPAVSKGRPPLDSGGCSTCASCSASPSTSASGSRHSEHASASCDPATAWQAPLRCGTDSTRRPLRARHVAH